MGKSAYIFKSRNKERREGIHSPLKLEKSKIQNFPKGL